MTNYNEPDGSIGTPAPDDVRMVERVTGNVR